MYFDQMRAALLEIRDAIHARKVEGGYSLTTPSPSNGLSLKTMLCAYSNMVAVMVMFGHSKDEWEL